MQQTRMVGDGGRAQEAFREMIHPDTSVERRAALRRALLEYCERDTMALVRLVGYLEESGSVVRNEKGVVREGPAIKSRD
ncbi:MAG: hypothetical protein L0Y67_06855 [Gammaproteobacteria bacterium]|nr:hypothetical protein [Gammaproteobacteria bacterium]